MGEDGGVSGVGGRDREREGEIEQDSQSTSISCSNAATILREEPDHPSPSRVICDICKKEEKIIE